MKKLVRMISRRITIIWLLGGIIVLAIVGIVRWRAMSRPSLPVAAHYGNLPGHFHSELARIRGQADADRNDLTALRHLARLYHANRLMGEARACYQAIGASRPGLSAQDHYYLADLALNENNLAEAQAELRTVTQREPGYLPARVILAESLFKSGHEDEAALEYETLLKRETHQPQALLGLARIALQRGDDVTAVAHLEAMREFHPEFASGASLLAQVLERRGESQRAEALRQFSRQIHDPDLPDPWLEALLEDCFDSQRLAIIAEQLLITGQVDGARRLLARMEELDPSTWIPPAVRGWSLAHAGQHLEALTEYRGALRKGGDIDRICPLLTSSLIALGRGAEAAAMLAEYLAKKPDSILLQRAAAEVAVWQGDEKQARILLHQVLRAEPYLREANLSLAKILWQAGERGEAVKCLERVAQVFPAEVEARGLLAQHYLENAEPGSAIPALEQAVAHVSASDPRHERLTAMLGTAYRMAGSQSAARGEFAEALRRADQALGCLPEELRAYALKAQACLRLKQYALARQTLEKMLTLAPGDPTVLLHLGDATYLAGDAPLARQHWEQGRQQVTGGDDELTRALDARLKGPFPPNLIP